MERGRKLSEKRVKAVIGKGKGRKRTKSTGKSPFLSPLLKDEGRRGGWWKERDRREKKTRERVEM